MLAFFLQKVELHSIKGNYCSAIDIEDERKTYLDQNSAYKILIIFKIQISSSYSS